MRTQYSIGSWGCYWVIELNGIDAMEGDAMMHLLTEGLNGGEDAGE